MTLDNLFRDGQADTRSWVFLLMMEPLKDLKNLCQVLGSNANAVVLHGKAGLTLVFLGRDVDARRRLAVELERVVDKVIKYLGQLGWVARDGR